MMKRNRSLSAAVLFFLLQIIALDVMSQYFYHDVLAAQSTTNQVKAYRQAKVRKVTLRSFETDGSATPGFMCIQEITPSYNQIKIFSQNSATQQSVTISSFNFKGQLTRSTDSSNTNYKTTTYSYAEDGGLKQVEISSGTYASKQREREQHFWEYEGPLPVRMWLVRQGADTTEVRFLPDETGKIAEEEWWKKGNPVEKYYYYYDTAGRLTDIVRFHERARRLLPDQIFTYTPEGRLAEWMSINTANGDYTTWRYSYNNKALREKDACYNKKKQLLGWITYSYE